MEKICFNGDDYVLHKFQSYKKVYDNLNDSIDYWVQRRISSIEYFQNKNEYEVDSLLLFSADSTNMYGIILLKALHTNKSVFDYLVAIGGSKINGKWYYYFMNVTYPINRGDYKNNPNQPLSFIELAHLARQRLMSLVKISSNNHFFTNEEFFQLNFYDNLVQCPKGLSQKACADSLIIDMSKKKYENLLNEKKRLIGDAKETDFINVPVDSNDNSSLNSLFDFEHTRFFESQEWKDYLKKKYGNSKN